MAIPALIHPGRLLWLMLLPVVWWLAQPPRPRQAVITAHLRQWLAARDALRRRPVRRRRLRTWVLLLALALAVLGHSELRMPGTTGPERLAVLLDGSASMAAREDDGSSAWQRAMVALEREFARLPQHVEVRLLTAGAQVERREGLAAHSLQDLAMPGGALGIDLQAMAEELAADPRSAVWTLTDGQGSAPLPGKGALTVLGTRRDNRAIVGVQVTDRWPLPELWLDVTVQDWSEQRSDSVFAVAGAVEAPGERPVTLAPGGREHVKLECKRTAAGGRLELQLRTPGDALPADDVWACELPPLPAPRIAVLCDAEAGPAVHAAAKTLAEEVAGSVVEASAGEAAFLLAEGGRADLQPGAVRALSFGTQLRKEDRPAVWPEPTVVDWDRSDPLTAGLDLSELRIAQAWHGILPRGKVLITGQVSGGPTEPLLVLVEGSGIASLHAAFRLQDSNLPSLAALPQLLRRSLLRAYGQGALIKPDPHNLDAAGNESDLRQRGGGRDRPLPAFAMPGSNLTALCLVLALCLLALRSWLR
jgi:hypothetical protein